MKRRAVLDPEELEFAAKYWDIGELGDMHHNPAKNVLHVKQTLAEMAAESGKSEDLLRPLRDSARAKLLAARVLAALRRSSTARFIPAGMRWR